MFYQIDFVKLLIFTQTVDTNDPVLGFFHRWIEEFSKHCESIIVICLKKGEYNLPSNVKVYSLGKEEGKSKFTYILRFYKYIFKFRKEYDSVFVHMNQIYVILGGIFWRLMNKKIGLWYMHSAVSNSLRVAEKLTNYVFTGSEKSFRLKSKKVNITGHAIDTDYFIPGTKQDNGILNIVTIGRISPTKNYGVLLDAVDLLKKDFRLEIVGGAGTPEQEEYFKKIKERESDKIVFVGAVPHSDTLKYLQKADVFVNMSDTGSVDKAVLEAMSVGLPVITSNEAFEMFDGVVMFEKNNTSDLVNKLENMKYNNLRDIVISNHSITKTIKKIVDFYE